MFVEPPMSPHKPINAQTIDKCIFGEAMKELRSCPLWSLEPESALFEDFHFFSTVPNSVMQHKSQGIEEDLGWKEFDLTLFSGLPLLDLQSDKQETVASST